MTLQKALELHTEYAGVNKGIRVNADEYICLNDMVEYFPGRSLDKWMKSDHAKEFVIAVETSYKLPPNGGIIARRGKNGGTWAHPMIAFEFATWLSPEFRLKVYKEYVEGNQNKKNWNIARIMAARNFRMMTNAIKNAHETPMSYHYSSEAMMLNEIVFGKPDGDVRDTATEKQLDDIAALEGYNAAYIDMGMEYDERKKLLIELYKKGRIKLYIESKKKNLIE